MTAAETLHILDWTCLAALFAGATFGMMAGFIRQTVRLLTYAAAASIALHLNGPVSAGLLEQLVAMDLMRATNEGVNGLAVRGIGFSITFSGVYLVLFLATRLFAGLIKSLFLNPCEQHTGTALQALGLTMLDRLGGTILGAAMAGLIAFPIVLGVSLYPNPRLQQSLAGSYVQPIAIRTAKAIQFAVPADANERFEDALRRLQATATDLGRNLSNRGM